MSHVLFIYLFILTKTFWKIEYYLEWFIEFFFYFFILNFIVIYYICAYIIVLRAFFFFYLSRYLNFSGRHLLSTGQRSDNKNSVVKALKRKMSSRPTFINQFGIERGKGKERREEIGVSLSWIFWIYNKNYLEKSRQYFKHLNWEAESFKKNFLSQKTYLFLGYVFIFTPL